MNHDSPIIEVPRRTLDIARPWTAAEGAVWTALTETTDGSSPRLATLCSLFHDDDHLYVHFRYEDDEVLAHYRARDEPIYEEEVLELFLAPEKPGRYFEFQISPIGTLFDAIVDNPDGLRETMHVDRDWNCEGLWGTVRRERESDGSWRAQVILSVPFRSLGVDPPIAGAEWRGNLFRIDRSEIEDSFQAWCPTLRTPPDFHVPDRFGVFRFVSDR